MLMAGWLGLRLVGSWALPVQDSYRKYGWVGWRMEWENMV